jgi:hypothetical protein
MEPLRELQQVLEERLEATRKMIDDYDEMMDYATQCTLQGFAEGLAYALEETKSRVG